MSTLLFVACRIAFAFGAYLDYKTTPIFGIVLAVLFAILFSFFPETPQFLVKRNRISVCVCMLKTAKNHLNLTGIHSITFDFAHFCFTGSKKINKILSEYQIRPRSIRWRKNHWNSTTNCRCKTQTDHCKCRQVGSNGEKSWSKGDNNRRCIEFAASVEWQLRDYGLCRDNFPRFRFGHVVQWKCTICCSHSIYWNKCAAIVGWTTRPKGEMNWKLHVGRCARNVAFHFCFHFSGIVYCVNRGHNGRLKHIRHLLNAEIVALWCCSI